jgi:hypothetical protein
MTFHPQSPGEPGEHLGISHTLKHYLAPKEMWQDVAHVVSSEFRPVEFLARHFPEGTPWMHWGQKVTDAEKAKWRELESAFRDGYLHVVTEYAKTLPELSVRFVAHGQRILMLHLGDGILLQLYDRAQPRVRTAFRKVGVSLHTQRAYEAVSQRLDALGKRLKQARYKARRQIEMIQSGQFDGTEDA